LASWMRAGTAHRPSRQAERERTQVQHTAIRGLVSDVRALRGWRSARCCPRSCDSLSPSTSRRYFAIPVAGGVALLVHSTLVCTWTKTYTAVLRRSRNAAARSRPHCRQRQRSSQSSLCRLSGVSGCPLPHVGGITGGSAASGSSAALVKHTAPIEWRQSGPPLPRYLLIRRRP
jgi:hypothetical protein